MKKYKLQLLLNEFRKAEDNRHRTLRDGDSPGAVSHMRYSEGLATAAILLLKDEDRDWITRKFNEITDEYERLRAVESFMSGNVIAEPSDKPVIPMMSIFKQKNAPVEKERTSEPEEETAEEPEEAAEELAEAAEEPEEDTKPEEVPKPEKPKQKNRAHHGAPPRAKNGKVDRGKVIALYNARWSAGKIADEMQCGLSTVYAILKEHTEGKLDNEVWNEEA